MPGSSSRPTTRPRTSSGSSARCSALPDSRRVLVVDDNSPDGTGEIADRLAELDERSRVLHRARKEGLGPAYLAGFDVALDGGAERIIEMDADFSHDPALSAELIEAAGAPTW